MSVRNRLLLDVALFAAIVLAYAPSVTGLSFHEWLSIAIAVPALLHLVINWDWVLHSVSKVLERLSAVSRLNLVVDALLFFAAVTVTLSGLMVSQVISQALGINVVATQLWHTTHSFSADATVLLLLTHFALHARWMANAFQGILRRSDSPQAIPTQIPVTSVTRQR